MGGAVRATKAVYFVGFRAAALRSPAGAMEEEAAAGTGFGLAGSKALHRKE